MSATRMEREQLLLEAVDAMIGADDLRQAEDIVTKSHGFQSDSASLATMGYLRAHIEAIRAAIEEDGVD